MKIVKTIFKCFQVYMLCYAMTCYAMFTRMQCHVYKNAMVSEMLCFQEGYVMANVEYDMT